MSEKHNTTKYVMIIIRHYYYNNENWQDGDDRRSHVNTFGYTYNIAPPYNGITNHYICVGIINDVL